MIKNGTKVSGFLYLSSLFVFFFIFFYFFIIVCVFVYLCVFHALKFEAMTDEQRKIEIKTPRLIPPTKEERIMVLQIELDMVLREIPQKQRVAIRNIIRNLETLRNESV